MKTADEMELTVPMDCCGQDVKSLGDKVNHTAFLLKNGHMVMAELYNALAIKAPADAKVMKMKANEHKNLALSLENIVLPDEVP